MQVTIAGRHVDVTDAMRSHAHEQAARLADHFDFVQQIEVTLDIDGTDHVCEMIASIRRGGPLVAHARTEDMYGAIDMTADKLERQLRKEKDRLKDRHRARRQAGEAADSEAKGESRSP